MRQVIIEGNIMTSIFQILRTVPRHLLMILKVNDLTRSLDKALHTTFPPSRIWLVVARYASQAVWGDDKTTLINEYHQNGFSLRWLCSAMVAWWRYERLYTGLWFVEVAMDSYGRLQKARLWLDGLFVAGIDGANKSVYGIGQ